MSGRFSIIIIIIVFIELAIPQHLYNLAKLENRMGDRLFFSLKKNIFCKSNIL